VDLVEHRATALILILMILVDLVIFLEVFLVAASPIEVQKSVSLVVVM
jgi:hypothetical protein